MSPRIRWDDVPDLGRVADSVIARRLGVDRRAVYQARVARGLPSPVRRGVPAGEAHPRAVLTAAQVRRLRRLAARGWSQREIAAWVDDLLGREPGTTRHTWVGRILRGETYPDPDGSS